jgi:hypothetical protein
VGQNQLPKVRGQPGQATDGGSGLQPLAYDPAVLCLGEEVKRSMDWLIKRLIKVGARISYHARRWYVHIASAFPLAHHYRAVLAWGPS